MRPEHWIYTIPLRMRSLFKRRQVDSELSDEIRDHIDRRAQELIAKGIAPNEARYAALREFGGVTKTAELCRETRKVNWLQDFFQDIRYGLRVLRKNPGFTVAILAIVALGIGASTSLFSVTYASLRKDPGWYVRGVITGRHPQQNARIFHYSIPEYVDFLGIPDTFASIGALSWTHSALTDGDYPELVGCAHISQPIIPPSGLRSVMFGRTFLPEEDRPGGQLAAILSYEMWQQHYASDPQILGKLIRLDGRDYTIVGVMRPLESVFGSSVMVPLQVNLEDRDRSQRNLWVLVTLKPGVTWEQADNRLNAVARRIEQEYRISNPEYSGLQLQFWNVYEAVTGGVQVAFMVLLAAVGFLWLICCANIANLLLARVSSRKSEFTIRAALGAGRGRIARQMLTESFLLAGAGAIAGIILARWSLPLVIHLIPSPWLTVPPESIRINTPILIVAVALSAFTGILFGAGPAWQLSRANVAEALKEGASKIGGARRGQRAQKILIVSEIALTFIVLASAVLMIKSYRNLEHIDVGFQPSQVLSMQISLPDTKYSTDEEMSAFYEKSIAKIESLPGVNRAAVVSGLPMFDRTVDLTSRDFTIEGRAVDNASGLANANYRVVSSGYFDVLGTKLIRGRLFSDHDRRESQRVAIINQTMANRYWPGADPIGERIHLVAGLEGTSDSPANVPSAVVTVIGIVSDIKQTRVIDGPVRQEFYLAEDQFAQLSRNMSVLVRSSLDAGALTSAIRQAIATVDSQQPVDSVESMEQVVSDSFGPKRITTVLLAFFAVIALVVSAAGIYAVISYSVGQRTRELGIRRALGALHADILKLIVWQGTKLTLFALAIGIGAAVTMAKLMAGLLYGVTTSTLLYHVNPFDPLVYGGVGLFLIVVALAACYIPARRAMRVDPMSALRHE